MLKEKKYNLAIFCSLLLIAVFAYTLFELRCFGRCDTYALIYMYLSSAGIAVSLVPLLFFHGRVFIAWLKHILWWYLILATLILLKPDNDLFLEKEDYIVILAVILFIVTIVYALIMSYILKKKNQ